MIQKNNNKVLPINSVLEVQQKLFDFEDFDQRKSKTRRRRTHRKSNDFQSKFDVGEYKDPEIKISDKFSNKYYMDENGVIGSLILFVRIAILVK